MKVFYTALSHPRKECMYYEGPVGYFSLLGLFFQVHNLEKKIMTFRKSLKNNY